MSVETQQPFEPSHQQPPAAPAPDPHTRLSLLSRWVRVALLGLVAVGVVIVAVALLTGGGSSGNGTVSGSNAFNISYPKTWSPLPKDKLASLPGHPLAVLRRNDGQGVVVIRSEAGAPPADLNKLGADLARQLRRRDPSLKIHTQKVVKLRSGEALFTTYLTRTGRVQSSVVVPAGKRTFTLNTFSRGGADDVAREIGKMIVSFDATP
jgi:hypothetical protein